MLETIRKIRRAAATEEAFLHALPDFSKPKQRTVFICFFSVTEIFRQKQIFREAAFRKKSFFLNAVSLRECNFANNFLSLKRRMAE